MAYVLLLSDDCRIRNALQHVLMEMGHTVVVQPLTPDTLPVTQSLSPQLILIDLPRHAQKEGGTIPALRKLYPTSKFIALFNGYCANVTQLARLWGVDDCLCKPFALNHLLAAVHQKPIPAQQ